MQVAKDADAHRLRPPAVAFPAAKSALPHPIFLRLPPTFRFIAPRQPSCRGVFRGAVRPRADLITQ